MKKYTKQFGTNATAKSSLENITLQFAGRKQTGMHYLYCSQRNVGEYFERFGFDEDGELRGWLTHSPKPLKRKFWVSGKSWTLEYRRRESRKEKRKKKKTGSYRKKERN